MSIFSHVRFRLDLSRALSNFSSARSASAACVVCMHDFFELILFRKFLLSVVFRCKDLMHV